MIRDELENYNDKYEYILPEITYDKNLISNEIIGNLDLQSNFKAHIYDTNKSTNFFVNDLTWNFREIYHQSGISSKLLANFKNWINFFLALNNQKYTSISISKTIILIKFVKGCQLVVCLKTLSGH